MLILRFVLDKETEYIMKREIVVYTTCIPDVLRLYLKKYETLISFKVGSSSFNALVVSIQPLPEGSLEVI